MGSEAANGKITFNSKKIGTYETQIISEKPKIVKVVGNYDLNIVGKEKDGDAMHSFESRATDKFGGKFNTIVNPELMKFYNEKINPFIESIKIDIDQGNVKWEVIIRESSDGKAWIGVQSRGGAGGSKNSLPGHALKNVNDKKAEYQGLGYEQQDILDFQVFQGVKGTPHAIRQVFWQYTNKKSYPPHPPTGTAVNSSAVTGSSGVSGSAGSSGVSGSAGTSGTSGSSGTSATNLGTVTPKITLKKKFGPGQIMGSIEKEVYFNESVFRDLQFDTPGEYVISVIPSTPDIEPTEWQVTVKPDPNAPQESRANEEEKADGTRPIITQIDKASMTLPAIEWDTSPDKQMNAEIATSIGYQPFFWYAGYQVTPENITNLTLYHDGIVPNVTIIFYDSIGFIKKEGMPLDNSKIEVFLNSGSDNLKSIHLRFKIVKFQENKGGTYTIHGILDLKDFYKQSYKSYTGTSFEVLRMISKENELGFNSNIESTQDSMKWSNTGKTPAQFMTEIMKHSYISDASFVGGYIDYYYCFNYVDIEKEWTRDISADVGIDSQGPASKALVDPPAGEKSLIRPLSFTNDKSQAGSSFHIAKFEVNNHSTSKSLKKGQFTITKYYDSSSKSFLIFNVDSLTSDNGKNLILKGSTTDKSDLETNFKTEYSGRIETENVHANYMYAEIQNKTNFNNLTRITIDMELSNANFNIYKFQKIKLLLVNPTPTASLEELNYERISGEWIIADIEYTWTNNRMSQKLVAVRKELGKTKEELENQKEETKEEKGDVERNENPVDDATGIVPNTVYKVGEYYSAVDKTGRIFSIEITEVSSNGIEVTANVLEIPKPPPPPPIPPDPPASAQTLDGNSEESSTGNSSSGADIDEKAKPKRSENPPAGVVKAMKNYGISKPLEQAHFIAQIAHESGQFQWTEELASGKAYEGRTDLGNTKKGDGVRYKGRGYMQLTGRSNYTKYAEYLKGRGVKDWDVVSNPDWVATKYPADVSCYFWKVSGPKGVKKFPIKAMEGSSTTIINKIGAWINGKNPPNGSDDRIERFKKYWGILQSDPKKYS